MSMSVPPVGKIHYRAMTLEDVAAVPTACQGSAADLEARIKDIGSAAVLAFDGAQHVAQLQFRPYDRACRSPSGIWDPLYWGDFGDAAPLLPPRTLSIFCYHVGQRDNSEARDASYQGRGIGLGLLDFLLDWAKQNRFDAVIAKATPAPRAVMAFMGGQPRAAYVERGFDLASTWVDPQLRAAIQEKGLIPADADLDEAARIGCCVRRL